MAVKKPSRVLLTDDEMNANNIKNDYYEDLRSKNGYIKIGFKREGTMLINSSIEKAIDRKQKDLEKLRKVFSAVEDIEEANTERGSYKESKSDKKEKKKEKKKKKKMKNLPESTKLLINAIDEYKDTYIKTKKDKDDEGSYSGITSYKKGEKRKEETDEDKEKRKADTIEKDFNKRFEEPIALMKQNLIDVDSTLKDIDDLLKETKESRARNRSTMIKDLLNSKVGLFSNKTQAIRSISDMQKVRIELSLKKQKEEGGDTNEKNRQIMAISQAFPQLVASGNKKKKDSDDDDDEDDKKDKKEKRKWKDKKYDSDEYEDKFDKRAASLIKNGKLELSAHEASIDIEGKYRVAIKKSFKNADWEVIAIDNNGNEIRGFKDKYPGVLPKKKNMNVKFDDENDRCKDRNTDNVYSVIPTSYI